MELEVDQMYAHNEKSDSLLENRASTHFKFNENQYVRLKQALNRGKKEIVETLLQEGCPVNGHPEGNDLRTPLHCSVYMGCPDTVKKLLERGASVNAKNLNNETPLMLAAKFEKHVLTDLLLHAHGLETVSIMKT
ncbi:hypothetical protein QAD02_011451 [Eretmocerus hayati]|uniref:Uncharacterized protein n=1 Tax=Eretmocerus hayati TaxID=131215 RepID=A0ACC2NWT8_9HYME|nr:hypothetical protein QAD02_011451 [Eretmocerus hayati]